MALRSQEFFDFVKERENVRLRKEAGDFFPWTEDPILSAYKFTNVQRHHDRTSMELRNQFYTPNYDTDKASILMNAAIYRYFGTHEFASHLGWTSHGEIDEAFWDHVKETARDRLNNKERVFTGAYVITNQGISAPKEEVVVDFFLRALHKKAPLLVQISEDTDSWEAVAKEMMKIQGFGGSGFMTKEILLDTTYTGFWGTPLEYVKDGKFSQPKDWWEWTPIGPGARRGASRVLGDDSAKAVKEQIAFDMIMRLFEAQKLNDMGPIEFTLSPHDIQFQLCEFDKYERVRLGQGKPRSRYHGPK